LHRVSLTGVARVVGRRDQLVGVDAAAVLGRAVTAASHAYRPRPGIRPGQQGFELDDVLPAVTKVIVVEEPVTSIDQHLIQAHVFLGDPRRPVFHLEGAQVVLGFGSVMPRAGAELVQVGVGPAERYLDDLVDLVEEQVGGQLKPAPQRRPCPFQVDPDTVGNDIWATWATPRRRRRRFEEAAKGRPGGEQALEPCSTAPRGRQKRWPTGWGAPPRRGRPGGVALGRSATACTIWSACMPASAPRPRTHQASSAPRWPARWAGGCTWPSAPTPGWAARCWSRCTGQRRAGRSARRPLRGCWPTR